MVDYRTQKILLSDKIDDEVEAYLLWCCYQSNSLYNSALFVVRQSHFEECETRTFFAQNDMYRIAFKARYVKASYAQLCKDFKTNKHYLALGGQQGQQCLKSVVEGINSYNQLLKKYWQRKIKDKPKIPGYRKSKSLYQVAFPAQAVRYNHQEKTCNLAISKECKPELVNQKITIPAGHGFTSEQLAEVRIVPSNGRLWAEYVYKVEQEQAVGLDFSLAIGIDPGVSNWLSITSNQGKSFIVCGRKIKSINQRYNKKVAQYKKRKPQKYWDDYLANLTHKRNCQMRDACSKAARFVINYCLNHGIGNIVFGWGQGVKTNSNLGGRNNQNFVQIPTARLKNRIQELAESVGIVFTETEESYSSKTSFLDGDFLPKYGGEKPPQWKPSGRRVTRGSYKTAQGKLISCDAQAAANIMRKARTQLGISLAEIRRECLTVPKRYDLTCLSKSYRKRAETTLQLVL
ncbi:MAG: transposase [Cyanobacteriota bacterium]|nr:transposase [Cyanobacteriota bacterium]